jgi:hypothetical protein
MEAATAMRHYERDILHDDENLKGYLTEELLQDFAPEVVASVNAARLAWYTYYRHLDGHGLLEPALKGEKAG